MKFANAEGKLPDIEENSIGLCRKCGNEAYPVGLTGESVLVPGSWNYHQLACELFIRLDTRTRGRGARIVVPERVARHAPPSWKDAKGYIDLFNTTPIAASLHAARPYYLA